MRKFLWMAGIGVGLLVSPMAARADESKGLHQQVQMDQLPGPVKSTIRREAGSQSIENLEKNVQPDGTVKYEAKFNAGSKATEIEVSPDGSVLNRLSTDPTQQPDQPGQPGQNLQQPGQNLQQPGGNDQPGGKGTGGGSPSPEDHQ